MSAGRSVTVGSGVEVLLFSLSEEAIVAAPVPFAVLPPPPPPPPPPELFPPLLGGTVTLKLLYSVASPYFTVAVRVTITELFEGFVTYPFEENTFSLLLFHVIDEPFILPTVSIVILLLTVIPLVIHEIAFASARALAESLSVSVVPVFLIRTLNSFLFTVVPISIFAVSVTYLSSDVFPGVAILTATSSKPRFFKSIICCSV